ncbi:MAG: DUF599 domain-containing protein [Methylococcales bacterium]
MSYDIIAFGVSCILVLAYYLYLNWRTRRAPESSVHALNARIRERWVAMVMASDKMDILAIQTLRNSVIAANFMASTSVLLIMGTLNLSDKIGQWALLWHPNAFMPLSNELWQIKLGLLLLDFAIAFYCFSMSIRFYNHVGYMINLGDGLSTDKAPYQLNCAYLNRAGSYYTFGNRAFFFSLPIIMWFFGPYFLPLATIGLIIGLATLDKVTN